MNIGKAQLLFWSILLYWPDQIYLLLLRAELTEFKLVCSRNWRLADETCTLTHGSLRKKTYIN